MEDGRPRLSSSILLARILSIAGHPFLLSPLTVAAASRNWKWTVVLAVGMILPLTVIVARNVRRGRWSDFDVSRHEQRGGLYYVAAPLLAITAVALYASGARGTMMRSVVAVAAMLAVGFLANRFLKVSLHMMFAAFCTVILGYLWMWAFVAAIAWSRWKLERHTLAEIAFGLVVGTIAGYAVA
ncbi:MAG TPA: hypothetical protein VJZ00_04240 [Thermoanaerobaculia bacterium]|nr:hypothetical protein [Thermoanaerobaculia bacterium]